MGTSDGIKLLHTQMIYYYLLMTQEFRNWKTTMFQFYNHQTKGAIYTIAMLNFQKVVVEFLANYIYI